MRVFAQAARQQRGALLSHFLLPQKYRLLFYEVPKEIPKKIVPSLMLQETHFFVSSVIVGADFAYCRKQSSFMFFQVSLRKIQPVRKAALARIESSFSGVFSTQPMRGSWIRQSQCFPASHSSLSRRPALGPESADVRCVNFGGPYVLLSLVP